MFKYDSFYDCLFENKKFLSVLCQFHSFNWKKLSKEEKYKVLDNFIKVYCEIFEIDNIRVKKSKSDRNSGSYTDFFSLVSINSDCVNDGNSYDVLDTLFHELRHNFQRRAVAGNLISIESVSKEQIEDWKVNFFYSPRGDSNYIGSSGDNSSLYHFQPVEEDAFKVGLTLTKKSYEIMKSVVGEDSDFISYCELNKNNIMIYFSDEEEYVKIRKENADKVSEIFKSNNKKFEVEKKCLSIAEVTMKKDLKEMNIEEIYSLFSVYVWAYLEDDYKIELLEEYDSRVNKYGKIKIQEDGNSAFKIDGSKALKTDIISILNIMFSYEVRKRSESIILGKEKCSEKLREELRINRYIHNKKMINYIRDSDNFFLYSMQPYALFEGKVVVEQFKALKDSEIKFYGIDDGDYDSMIDFYDNSRYVDFIEKFYEMPFKRIYNSLLEKMKNNIKKVEATTR